MSMRFTHEPVPLKKRDKRRKNREENNMELKSRFLTVA